MSHTDFVTETVPCERYDSLARFYNADERRVHSRELDVGLWWREAADGPLHRAAWVSDTGELYLVRLGPAADGGGRVEVLASVEDRELLERVLDGWRERCGEPRSLQWLRERASLRLYSSAGDARAPSSGSGSQGAAESTNCRNCGRMPGSRSSVPSRTATSGSDDGSPLNSADPHVPQNSLGTPTGGVERSQLLLARQQPEALLRHTAVGRGARAGAPLTVRAVAVAGGQERCCDLEAHRTAQAAALQRRARGRGGSRRPRRSRNDRQHRSSSPDRRRRPCGGHVRGEDR